MLSRTLALGSVACRRSSPALVPAPALARLQQQQQRRPVASRPPATGSPAAAALDVDTTTAPRPASSPADDMPLAEIIRKTITATGPMPLARYMHLCLSHPTQGYYTSTPRGGVFGRQGDFVTSPEISQTFGELIAIWLITRWQANGSPKRVRLLELGPGKGTLLADVLRTFLSFPEIAHAIQAVDLVESSAVLRGVQQDALGPLAGGRLRWFDRVADVPKTDAFTLFVAHEFFDALPIHLLERIPSPSSSSDPASPPADLSDSDPPTFRELLVSHTPPSPDLHLTLSPTPTAHATHLPTTAPHFAAVAVGSRVEVSPGAFSEMSRLGGLLDGGGGAGLVVDYGKDGCAAESFRAFKSHAPVSPFAHPGTSDLTANVDFFYLRHALSSLSSPPLTLGPIPQAEFLESMGLSIRLAELLKLPSFAEDPKAKEELEGACERLVDRNGMGSEYVFFGVESPPGGEAADPEMKVYPFHGPM